MPDIFDQYVQPKPSANPTIYVYSESYLPGYLKVGYTTKNVEDRMNDIHPLNTPVKTWKVLYTTPALYADGTTFMDHDVHKELVRRGFRRIKDDHNKTTEFFRCSLDDVKAAIVAVKTHSLNEEDRTATFAMRPEQAAAVDKTIAYFESEKKANPNHSVKFLWNCKMRFGKTFAAYELARKMEMKRVLVLTFKPAVEDSWESDLLTHVDFKGWQFYSSKYGKEHNITPDKLDQDRPIVCFGSFQDFLGTDENGGIKSKNEWVHTTNWDLVIFDEYHFGAWRENAKKLFYQEDEDSYDTFDLEKYKTEEADNAYNETFLPITTSYYLFLSGTPFRALNTGEFVENQIYSWTYTDEQNAKAKWPELHPDQPNPYAALPRMIMMTYKLPDELERVAKGGEFDEFDLNVFFHAKEETDGDPNSAKFVYENEVQKWLDMIRGAYLPMSIDDLKRVAGKPVMPFSDTRMLNVLSHTLWFLPNVDSCYAMRNLLMQKQNTFYHDYKINLCAGSSAGIGLAAVQPVRNSMDPPLETKTITLSCGKLTTGVTIKPWTGILMLRNLSSPETYFQAAFRVQSPWTIKDDNNHEEIIKKDCYVFDFAVNRALREIADYSMQLNVHESNPEKKVGDFIQFLPVLAFDGSAMVPIDAASILDIVTAGTSASLLARRWQSALLVNVDNATLDKLLHNEKALNALMGIEDFRSLNSDIATIINKSEHVKSVKREKEKLTPKQAKQLSDEEKESKSARKVLQKKLIKLATRIPIFMYLTDYREMSLKDVITKIEPPLFTKVTGLTLDDFELLVSLGVFNDSVMNDSIYKFKRYEDNSLTYTGVNKHAADENVGLFTTVISRAEYDRMAKEQGLSIEKPDFSVEHITNKEAGIADEFQPLKDDPSPIVKKEAPLAASTLKKAESTLPSGNQKWSIEIGDLVEHKKFGTGKVTRMDNKYVWIQFVSLGEKMFEYPGAFQNGFLALRK
ncbi:MAG: GIY-YIG nuclease family protein [Galactobacillus timonensis]|uniref:GIY-YIG nuclease family protein n=1 Tax=Galactobacillus timonensis TaxID=2041840 RepID=UPI0023F04948|nr:GIY-YIG nuclease family protein [Galactobacillus timonensis]MCI6067184.1 GIY-YIG nuclease family protein [Galactobacillus timonensis]